MVNFILTDFENGTIEIALPDDENAWVVSIRNFRYETISLEQEHLNYLVSASNVLIDYIEKHGKFYGDIDSIPE